MMHDHEFLAYWAPAASSLFTWEDEKNMYMQTSRQLARALGLYPEYLRWADMPDAELDEMKPELRDLLIKLAGPHGRAILKAYQVQRGLE